MAKKLDNEITDALKSAGFDVVIGKEAVLEAIGPFEKDRSKWLCSGFGCFSDGTKCPGCDDCRK